MTQAQIEIQMIAVLVAVACALPGVFLVLRGTAMMSDAISHAILPGLVVGFFLTQDLTSPVLIIGAVATGLLTVSLVELLGRTRLVQHDAAIGLVFSAMFSLGVILITRYAGDVHLDVDAVLLGELAFAPFDRLMVAGRDVGPKSYYVMAGILLLNLTLLLAVYKELKVTTFDPGLAASLGFLPGLLNYLLMASVSVTVVGAFEAVGSILVVALMIAPPAAALLLVKRLSYMLVLSAAFGAVSAVLGYWMSHALDASIAGCMASVAGLVFLSAFLFAPERGLVSAYARRQGQRVDFALATLTIHLMQHRGTPEAQEECRVQHLQRHLNWRPAFAAQVAEKAQRRGLAERRGDLLAVTPAGEQLAARYLRL